MPTGTLTCASSSGCLLSSPDGGAWPESLAAGPRAHHRLTMEELNPPPLDPERIDPDPEAEPIAALTFLLELPHCLRIEDVVFLASDRGGSWPGWDPHAVGHVAGFERPVPEDDLRPRFRVHIRQIRIDGWARSLPLIGPSPAGRRSHGPVVRSAPPRAGRTNCEASLRSPPTNRPIGRP